MIGVIDYGAGNLNSILKIFNLLECEVDVLEQARTGLSNTKYKGIVLPGVGSYEFGMTSIKNLGFYDWIKGPLKVNKTPLLGICLGMQFFADLGSEGRGMHEGLGLIPGEVLRLSPNNKDEKVPHMGWNSVTQVNDHQIYNNIPDESDFYFAHSYHFIPNDRNHVLGHTDYCGGVVSVVSFQNVIGVQFHPEKSSKVGSLMISNFITMTNA